MGGFHSLYELCGLRAVSMCGEADLLNREVDSDGLVVLHAGNAVPLFEVAGDAALCAVAGYADPVFGVVAPPLQQRA